MNTAQLRTATTDLRAMAQLGAGQRLVPISLPLPEPEEYDVLLRVHTCGVCRTDLHIIDGELAVPGYPVVPGHEIVGSVVANGKLARRFAIGQRVGVAWLASACGACPYCDSGRENLCGGARFTGLHRHGGYATHVVADERFCFALPDRYDDVAAAPLLCAGLIGYRALAAAGDARRIGIYGFGAAGHLIAQVAVQQGREVYAFTRAGDGAAQALARSLGVDWAGSSEEAPPEAMDAAILLAPVGSLLPRSLAHVARGGTVVCAGIHMSDIPRFPYRLLWGERNVRSIANLTRADGEAFMDVAAKIPLRVATEIFSLDQANTALDRLRAGRLSGAAVLDCANC
jgi:alcohol dehydrogenase, propanol-preferring